jgi:hypothetical protein
MHISTPHPRQAQHTELIHSCAHDMPTEILPAYLVAGPGLGA